MIFFFFWCQREYRELMKYELGIAWRRDLATLYSQGEVWQGGRTKEASTNLPLEVSFSYYIHIPENQRL